MSKAIRFSSAAVGMVLLAGLAYYQTHPDPARGQEGILTGTALPEPSQAQDSEEPAQDNSTQTTCSDSQDTDTPPDSDCTTKLSSTGTY